MELVDNKTFFELTENFEYIPHTQSREWLWFTNADQKDKAIYLLDNIRHPSIACFAHVKKKFGIKMLWIEGECLRKLDTPFENISTFYKEICGLGYLIIEVNSAYSYHADYEVAIRKAGYLRPCGLFSTPLTIQIALDKDITYNRNWERNLRKSEKFALQLEEITAVRNENIAQFVSIYNSMAQYKGFSYRLSIKSITRLLEGKEMKLFQLKDASDEVYCMRIIHIHNDKATDVFAANTEKSRENAATYFMMQTLFKILRTSGCTLFDFGRILPGHKGTDSVTQFKSGVHGEKVLYAGEWSWYKKSCYRPMMYMVKKYLLKKTEV